MLTHGGALPSVLRVRCHYCSHFRSPNEILHLGTGGAKMCFRCMEWHRIAMAALCGQPPPGCQECGVTFADLKECDSLGNLRMSLVVKDGIYQILCTTCSDSYERKRADLYRHTVYGQQKGI
jgi:hypothetical protein